jgi:hypothetical protein
MSDQITMDQGVASRCRDRRPPTKRLPTPNRVTTHPGEVLGEEFLSPLGMSVNALATALRVPATRVGASSRASVQ